MAEADQLQAQLLFFVFVIIIHSTITVFHAVRQIIVPEVDLGQNHTRPPPILSHLSEVD